MPKSKPDLIGVDPSANDEAALQERFDPERLLSLEELVFVESILNGNTRSTAYRLMNPNYLGEHATTMGSAVANRPHVKAALDSAFAKARAEIQAHASKNAGRLLDEYIRLAYFDPAKLLDNTGRPLPLSEIDEDTRRAIVALEVVDEFEGKGDARTQIGTIKKYKMADKQRAMDSLAKVLGLLVEKTEVTGKDGEPLVPVVSNEDLARRIAFILMKADKQPEG